MKKALPFIFLSIILIILLGLILVNNSGKSKKFDQRITLRSKDKIPYGFAAAKTLIPAIFDNVNVTYDTGEPGKWKNIDVNKNNQAIILVANYFDASEAELFKILNFIKKGNYVLIIAKSFSYEAERFFHTSLGDFHHFDDESADSIRVKLNNSIFKFDSIFTYPGKRYDAYFLNIDSSRTVILGSTSEDQPNYIQLSRGQGHIFIHSAPIVFSNYFILHKQNIKYFQSALSVIPRNIISINWNEYYLFKIHKNDETEPNWLAVMLQQSSFKWGFYTIIIFLFLFLLLSMRRTQKLIPLHEKPKNESIEFVKTIGMLYYDQKDHRNLAEKMSIHFLDHIRLNYKITTDLLDDEFIQNLHAKSQYPFPEINEIVLFIKNLNTVYIGETQLSKFYNQLEMFYLNTR